MKYYTIKDEYLPLWTNDTSVTSETVIDSDEVSRLAREWGKDEKELIEQLVEIPAPETLMDLTGHEAGIVIYTSDEMIICNWSQYGPNELPKVFAGITVMGWDEGEDIFADAKEEFVEDYRPLLDSRDLIWDQLNDMKQIADPETEECWFRASVYTLRDGTIIIAPQMWN